MFHFPILKIDTSVTNPRFLVKLVATCNEENFFLKGSIFGYEHDAKIFTHSWDIEIPRVVF